jgi:hypothetical protein
MFFVLSLGSGVTPPPPPHPLSADPKIMATSLSIPGVFLISVCRQVLALLVNLFPFWPTRVQMIMPLCLFLSFKWKKFTFAGWLGKICLIRRMATRPIFQLPESLSGRSRKNCLVLAIWKQIWRIIDKGVEDSLYR